MTLYTVLMLTADSHYYRRLAWLLARKDCLVLRVGTPEALEEATRNRQFTLILAQVSRVGGEELALLKRIKKVYPRTRLVLCREDREKAFPPEAYQLEVDDYFIMPCRLEDFWRRLAACLKKAPGESRDLAPWPSLSPRHRTSREKYRRIFDYFRYSLEASTAALKTLGQTSGAKGEEKLLPKISAVAARLEILQEMAEELWRGGSGVEMLHGFMREGGKPAFTLGERPATAINSSPVQQPYAL
jgi:DNA-binding NarL/FixJ family response regulator